MDIMTITFSGVSLILSFLLVYIVIPFLRTQLSKKEMEIVKDVIMNIVASLENENIDGKDKKVLAIKLIKRILELKKINVPLVILNPLIESSLYFLRKKFGKPKKKQKQDGLIATYSVKDNLKN